MTDPLQTGIDLLSSAGHDKVKLGSALIYIHGALEVYFRDRLNMPAEDQTKWPDLINAWKEKYGLAYSDERKIYKFNGIRNKVAHVKPFHLSRTDLEDYAKFVQNFMGRSVTPSASQYTSPAPRFEPTTSRPTYPTSSSPTTPRTSQPRTPARPAPAPAPKPARGRTASCLIRLFLVWGLLSFCYLTYDVVSSELMTDVVNPVFEEIDVPFDESILPESIRPEFEGTLNPFDNTPNNGISPTAPPTALPQADSPAGSPATEPQIRVRNVSNVRDGPGTTFEIVGTAAADATFIVLETNAEQTWYKIQLENGREGWIGSSRVERLAP